ncbi:hypothetical protein AGMMS49982_04590 [Bacteroidia bacterium]|nr:hypothetical protein AGMMS49982_04590 [Bacteroidia bacterium]
MHYIIIIAVIALIVIFQFKSYLSNKGKLEIFDDVFPENDNQLELLAVDENVVGISTQHSNSVLNVIVESINNYLLNNAGAVSDFHIIKDIVDRNCDAKEEEIDTQIPVPLYLGLMGTMVGILIGVGFLVISGGLSDLLGNATIGNGAEGVQTLLGGVALAMVSSIVGILLTISGSSKAKNAKVAIEQTKNVFLSWIQANLLPKLSGDIFGTLEKMAANLAKFNETFSGNTKELRETLQHVNESYQYQVETMRAIKELKINRIAAANIEVYSKLKNCTDEIGYFSTYLHSVNEYIANVKALNENLDKNENRAKAIEKMGLFFETEISQVEARKAAISKAVGTVDTSLQDALLRLRENTDTQLAEFAKATIKQQQALQDKLEGTSIIVDELKNLTAVKDSMLKLEKATNEQTHKIDRLAGSIEKLAQMKASGGVINSTISKGVKISALAIGGIIALSCVTLVGISLMDRKASDEIYPNSNVIDIPIDIVPTTIDSVAISDSILKR